MKTKKCSTCLKIKPLTAFYKNADPSANRNREYQDNCIECSTSQARNVVPKERRRARRLRDLRKHL